MITSQGAPSKEDLARVKASTDNAAKGKAQKELEKRIAGHPIYTLLHRAASGGDLPFPDELRSLNVTPKRRNEIMAAARRIQHEAESPPEADEVKTRSGKVKVQGVTSAAFLARSMAWDKAEQFIKALPSQHETQEETATRQAEMDPEAVADAVIARVRGTRG